MVLLLLWPLSLTFCLPILSCQAGEQGMKREQEKEKEGSHEMNRVSGAAATLHRCSWFCCCCFGSDGGDGLIISSILP